MDENKTFSDLAQMVKENQKPELKSISRGDDKSASVLLVPEGMTPHSVKKYLDEMRLTPERRTGNIKLTRLDSLADVVNRFKNKASVLYANATIKGNSISAHIKAYLDYHAEGEDVTVADNLGHTASYDFPISNEFAVWLEGNKKAMSQADFCLFLEEHISEIVVAETAEKSLIEGLKPKFAEPLEMLALSRDLEIYATGKVKQKTRLQSGEVEIQFTEEHKDVAGNPIVIPDFFVIKLAIFEASEPERVIVRLRYRLAGEGKVVWFYDLYRVDLALQARFNADCEWVKDETSLPLFFGTAEK